MPSFFFLLPPTFFHLPRYESVLHSHSVEFLNKHREHVRSWVDVAVTVNSRAGLTALLRDAYHDNADNADNDDNVDNAGDNAGDAAADNVDGGDGGDGGDRGGDAGNTSHSYWHTDVMAKRVHAPTLCIGGEDDVLAPPGAVRDLGEGKDNWEVHILRKSGHMVYVEQVCY